MKGLIFFIFCFLSANLFAQLDYNEDIKTIIDRTEINLSVPSGFKLETQKTRDGVCYLFVENSEADIKVKYVVWGARDYMKGLTKKKKKSAKEKKEEEQALFHPNRTYEQTFMLLLMKLNDNEVVGHQAIDKNKLNTIYFADWGGITNISKNENAKITEGKYNIGFCIHKKDVANIYVFVDGNDKVSLYKAAEQIFNQISFTKEIPK